MALASFSGKHMHLFLRKHADRLHEDVLEAVNATTTEEGEQSWCGRGAAALVEAGRAAFHRPASNWRPSPGASLTLRHARAMRPPLLGVPAEGGDVGAGLLGKVASLVGGGKGGPALAAQREGAEDDRVHVFTVASGHMCGGGGQQGMGWTAWRQQRSSDSSWRQRQQAGATCEGGAKE